MRISRPSPATVIALIALFVALGGSAYALSKGSVKTKHIAKKAVKTKQLGNGAVKTKQLANGAVKGVKIAGGAIGSAQIAPGAVGGTQIAAGAVGGSQVAANSLSGPQIDESGLGTVPSVENFDVIGLRSVAPSASQPSTSAARDAASRVALFTGDGFAIYGKCFTNISDPADPWVNGEIYLEAGPGAVFDSDDEDGSANGFLLASDPEDDRQLARTNSVAGPGNPGTLNILRARDSGFWAAQGTRFIEGNLVIGTKVGSPAVGDGVFGPGNRCLFGGTVRSG